MKQHLDISFLWLVLISVICGDGWLGGVNPIFTLFLVLPLFFVSISKNNLILIRLLENLFCLTVVVVFFYLFFIFFFVLHIWFFFFFNGEQIFVMRQKKKILFHLHVFWIITNTSTIHFLPYLIDLVQKSLVFEIPTIVGDSTSQNRNLTTWNINVFE